MNLKKIIPLFLILSLFSAKAFAGTPDISVTPSVDISETSVKVVIKNNTTSVGFRTTLVISDTQGYSNGKDGILDPNGDQIVVLFSGLTKKHNYRLDFYASPISGGGNYFGKAYTLFTDFAKPAITEVSANQTPPTIPQNPTNTSGSNNPPTTQNTNTSQTTSSSANTTNLTPSQIAEDKKGSGLVPCTNTCDFNDLIKLVNNLITFLIVNIFPIIVVLLFIYAGFQYLTAEGNPSKKANLKKMVKHIFLGMLLVMCSWLIVKTILVIVSSDSSGVLQFLQ